ncbi:MAG: hypothetical protein J6S60_06020 [Oscillospiraceae bacterium]|nr:hypothetical protein [Oscillospiraceae bacterium]
MLRTRPIYLLTIDLSMFGEAAAAAPAGEGSAPAAAAAPAEAPEVRYGKQPEQTAAPQQTQTSETKPETPEDKARRWKELVKGEFKDQYTDDTQKLINRRFREADAQIKAMKPIVDFMDQWHHTNGDTEALMNAIRNDSEMWDRAAEAAGMTAEQFRRDFELEANNRKLERERDISTAQYKAIIQADRWAKEVDELRAGDYPEFDLEAARAKPEFEKMLKGGYPVRFAYESTFREEIQNRAIEKAVKAALDNIKARGSRPAEAGANATPAFAVKDDVSKLSNEDVLKILAKIGNRERVTFG